AGSQTLVAGAIGSVNGSFPAACSALILSAIIRAPPLPHSSFSQGMPSGSPLRFGSLLLLTVVPPSSPLGAKVVGFGAGFDRRTLRLGRAELGTGQLPRLDLASSARLLDHDHLRDGSGGHDWRRWVSRATRYKHGTEHNGTDNAEHRQINAEQQHRVYLERYTRWHR